MTGLDLRKKLRCEYKNIIRIIKQTKTKSLIETRKKPIKDNINRNIKANLINSRLSFLKERSVKSLVTLIESIFKSKKSFNV